MSGEPPRPPTNISRASPPPSPAALPQQPLLCPSAAQNCHPVPLTPHPTPIRTTCAQNPLLAFHSGDPSKPGPHLPLQKERATLFPVSALESLNFPRHTRTCLHSALGSVSLLTPFIGNIPLSPSGLHGQGVHGPSLTVLLCSQVLPITLSFLLDETLVWGSMSCPAGFLCQHPSGSSPGWRGWAERPGA